MAPPKFGAGGGSKMPKNRKVALFAIGGLGGLGLVYWYKRKNAAAATADTTGTTTDPSIDPATGIPYAEEYSGGYGSSLGGIYDPATGQTYTGAGGPPIVTQVTSNAQWAQAAEAYLISLGYDPVTTSAALGAYLAGIGLTQDQLAIVQAAIGFEGQPPNPPAPPHVTGPPTGTGPPPVGGQATVPNVVGNSVNLAIGKLLAAGFRYKLSQVRNPSKRWVVTAQSPSGGAKASRGSVVMLTIRTR